MAPADSCCSCTGTPPAPEAKATDADHVAIGAGELAVAAPGAIAALQIFRGRGGCLRLGGVALAAFVADGRVNETLLSGQPTDAGTIANVIAAAIILGCLEFGRTAMPRARRSVTRRARRVARHASAARRHGNGNR